MKPIGVGSDDAGATLRLAVAAHLRELGYEVDDYGVDDSSSAYPQVAFEVAAHVASGKHDRAVLCCGTGIGMAIAANKVSGVYAAQVHDPYSAERARASNNAQVMTLGARVIGPELAVALMRIWLSSEFQGRGSARKVAKIAAAERALAAGVRAS